jgi:hypothetical protein
MRRNWKVKTLNLNAQIPRIVKRFEGAFAEIGLTFHKTRTARLFYRRMSVLQETARRLLDPPRRRSSASVGSLFAVIPYWDRSISDKSIARNYNS